MSGSTYYLIIRDENGGSIVTEETGDADALRPFATASRQLFPEVEFHTVCDNGRGADSYRLVKQSGDLSQFFHETADS